MVTFLNPILDPILSPLLYMDPFIAMIIVSLLMSVIITVVYKYTTNQAVMKELKNDLKKYREKYKQHKGNTQKQIELQTEMLKINNKYMMQSLRPTLFTMIPIIILLGWMQAHFGVEPLQPNQPFLVSAVIDESLTGEVLLSGENFFIIGDASKQAVDGKISWEVEATRAGTFPLTFNAPDAQVSHDVTIGSSSVSKAIVNHKTSIQRTTVEYKKLEVFPFSIFGWTPGWLGTYIIFSILFSVGLRKAFKLA